MCCRLDSGTFDERNWNLTRLGARTRWPKGKASLLDVRRIRVRVPAKAFLLLLLVMKARVKKYILAPTFGFHLFHLSVPVSISRTST